MSNKTGSYKYFQVMYACILMFVTVICLILVPGISISKKEEDKVVVRKVESPTNSSDISKPLDTVESKKDGTKAETNNVMKLTKPLPKDVKIKLINARDTKSLETALVKALKSEGYVQVSTEIGAKSDKSTLKYKKKILTDMKLLGLITQSVNIDDRDFLDDASLYDVELLIGN